MPRVSYAQTNFTAGEISPRLLGRVDIDRYSNAVSTMQNCYAVIHGGAKSRPGTLYLTTTKNQAKRSRLVPFIYSRDQAYMLLFDDGWVRVYRAGGGAMLAEIASPYTEAMLPDMDYVQGADTMFLAHPDLPIHRLRRFSDTAWDLSPTPFVVTPFDEQGLTPAVALTLSAATVGTGRTATAASGVFLPTDVGRALLAGSGQATVTGYTSSTQVTVSITIAFSGTALAAGAWTLDSSPQAILKPSAKDPVASTITLRGSQTRAADLTLSGKSGDITITASPGIFTAGDNGRALYADSGVVTLTYVSSTECTGTTSSDFISTSYATGGWGITADTWRAGDVGAFVRINGGLVRITELVSANEVRGTVVTALTGTVVAPPLAWSLETAVWNATNGYPRTVSLHEQRLVAAGTAKHPQTIWGSVTGEYLNFTKGVNDTDSYSFTIAADEVNPISYLASLRNLVVHTYGGEFSLQGGVEKPITPTNVRIRPETAHGSKGVRPVLIGKESVFVQRAGRKVRAMSYAYNVDGYQAPDLTVLAEHITDGGGVVEMAYQQEPDLIMWAVRADGAMLSCTIDRDQQVTAWAKHFTDGAFESVATIPNGARDETWVIVRRTVAGVTKRYIERFDETFEPQLTTPATGYPPVEVPEVFGCTMDCAVVVDNAGGQTVFSGLGHLEGKTVSVLADGSVLTSRDVAGGTITIERSSRRTLIGLPFLPKITLLTPEVGTGTGTAQGNSMRTSELTLRLLATLGVKVMNTEGQSQVIPFRRLGTEVLDKPPASRTQNVRIETLGWDRGSSPVSIVQEQPLPLHVLSAIRKMQVND